jgi:hypothetical protein
MTSAAALVEMFCDPPQTSPRRVGRCVVCHRQDVTVIHRRLEPFKYWRVCRDCQANLTPESGGP